MEFHWEIIKGNEKQNFSRKFLFNRKPPSSPFTYHNTPAPFTDEFTSHGLCYLHDNLQKDFITPSPFFPYKNSLQHGSRRLSPFFPFKPFSILDCNYLRAPVLYIYTPLCLLSSSPGSEKCYLKDTDTDAFYAINRPSLSGTSRPLKWIRAVQPRPLHLPLCSGNLAQWLKRYDSPSLQPHSVLSAKEEQGQIMTYCSQRQMCKCFRPKYTSCRGRWIRSCTIYSRKWDNLPTPTQREAVSCNKWPDCINNKVKTGLEAAGIFVCRKQDNSVPFYGTVF